MMYTGNELEGKMILADGQYYDLDCHRTQLNNNVLVVGASGGGKTRSICSPNILQAIGSYVISDPKGSLYVKYADYLRACGYRVRKLNIADPADPLSDRYSFFRYIRNEQDILKIAHMIAYADAREGNRVDPFWDEMAEVLLIALIGYLKYFTREEEQNISSILQLVQLTQIDEDSVGTQTATDLLFEDIQKLGNVPHAEFVYNTYQRFRIAAGRTLRSVLVSVASKLAAFDTQESKRLFERDTMEIERIGREKIAVFVVVSDTDRSMDRMANIFFTQAMNELCRVADALPGQRLPVDVRFLLDDFATNVRIAEFPRMIASIRSRGISAMLFIQAESQLMQAYGEDGRTIIANCDSYVYLGGNDLGTAKSVAERVNLPLDRVLYMPVGHNWILRRGSKPVFSRNFDPEKYREWGRER